MPEASRCFNIYHGEEIVIILLQRQANKTGLGVVHISLTRILTLIFRPGQLKMIVIKYQ